MSQGIDRRLFEGWHPEAQVEYRHIRRVELEHIRGRLVLKARHQDTPKLFGSGLQCNILRRRTGFNVHVAATSRSVWRLFSKFAYWCHTICADGNNSGRLTYPWLLANGTSFQFGSDIALTDTSQPTADRIHREYTGMMPLDAACRDK